MGGHRGPGGPGLGLITRRRRVAAPLVYGSMSHPLGTISTMERQLPLLDENDDENERVPTNIRRPRSAAAWQLDSRARAAGRQGLAQARRALEEAAGRAARRSAA